MTETTVPALLTSLLRDDPARPFLTFYDGATGERTELSVKSFDNWVAKTANLLQDELEGGPGTHISLWLPTHWLSAVWMCAAATCGVVTSPGPGGLVRQPGGPESPVGSARHRTDVPPPDVLVCGPDTLEAAQAAAGSATVVALSLTPLAGRFTEPLPEGILDYGAEVLAQPDAFSPSQAPDSEAPSVYDGEFAHPQGELLGEARHQAGRLGIHHGGRLLTHLNPATLVGFIMSVLTPMVSNGSVVLVRHGNETLVDGLVDQERVNARVWHPE